MQTRRGKGKASRDGAELDEAAVVEAALSRGIAFLPDKVLISLIANRREEDPAVVEAAIRELEDRSRKIQAPDPADGD